MVLKIAVLNSLHQHYRFGFLNEYNQILSHSVFAELVFDNKDLVFSEPGPHHLAFDDLFSASFESLALSLARLWDERPSDMNLISIPNLKNEFANHKYLGCLGLRDGQCSDTLFQTLYRNPLRAKLRVARTEALAHSIRLGTSRDRSKIPNMSRNSFDLENGDILDFSGSTLELLADLLDQLHLSSWSKGRTVEELREEQVTRHSALIDLVKQP